MPYSPRSMPESFKRLADGDLLDEILDLYQSGRLAREFTLFREDFDEGGKQHEDALYPILDQSSTAKKVAS